MKKYSAKKQAERKNSILPNGVPKKIRVYDNGGETMDRYTIVFTGNYTHNTGGQHWYLGMSQNPFLGVGSHGSSDNQIDKPSYKHLGKKIKFDNLTEQCKECVMQTYLYLWGFTDENGKEI